MAAATGRAVYRRARDTEREQGEGERGRESPPSSSGSPFAKINKEAKSRREEAERSFCGFRVGSLS